MYLRRNVSGAGPIKVFLATGNTPFFAGYEFDNGFMDKIAGPTPTIGWVSSGPVPAAADSTSILPTNTDVMVMGRHGPVSGVRETITYAIDDTLDSPTTTTDAVFSTLRFNSSGDRVLVSGSTNVFYEYNFSGIAIGSLVQSFAGLGFMASPRFIGSDYSACTITGDASIRTFNRATGAAVDVYTVVTGGAIQALSMSDILTTGGNPVMFITTSTGGLTILQFSSSGLISTISHGLSGFTRVWCGRNGNVFFVRAGFIDRYKFSSDGSMTLKGSIAFSDTVNFMEYSQQQDCLFIGHNSSPYISAYQVGSTFGTKFTDPAVAVGSKVDQISIQESTWTNFRP